MFEFVCSVSATLLLASHDALPQSIAPDFQHRIAKLSVQHCLIPDHQFKECVGTPYDTAEINSLWSGDVSGEFE